MPVDPPEPLPANPKPATSPEPQPATPAEPQPATLPEPQPDPRPEPQSAGPPAAAAFAATAFAATPRAARFNVGAAPETRLEGADAVGLHGAVHEPEPVALLVCHGMGQQVRFETIGQIGASILNQAKARGAAINPNGVQISAQGKGFLARAELNWTLGGRGHQVHLYEAYWAPITEGKVSYAETLQFLFQAAWRGFRCSRWFGSTTFERWMFGDMQNATIAAMTRIALLLVAVILTGEAASIAFVTLRVAAGVKEVSSLSWPAMPGIGQASLFALADVVVRDLLQVLKPFVPQHALLHHPGTAEAWGRAAAKTAAWFLLIAQGFFMRYFLIEYAGDVAAYISPYKDSKFDSIRSDIQAVGLNAARVIYGFDQVAGVPPYRRIVVAGHSLGSVLAYDTLNAILNLDMATAPAGARHAVDRTTHLITFGSPLDKTAFLFRNQSNHITDPIREQMAAGFQPLIRAYDPFRKHLKWINLWSKMDIVSGALDYYDAVPEGDPRHILNLIDPDAKTPLKAHVEYWDGRLLAETLYDAVK